MWYDDKAYLQKYIPFERPTQVNTEISSSYHLKIKTPGDLSSLYFIPNVKRTLLPHQVRVRVRAVGLNFRDLMLSLNMLKDEEITLGLEYSGEVVEIGSEVKLHQVGDEIIGLGFDTFADHLVLNQAFMTKKPKHLNWEQAAAVPLVFATVYYALYDKLKPTKGETILIHSAAGGIGQAAVLLSKHLGLRVLVTCGTPEKKKLLLSKV